MSVINLGKQGETNVRQVQLDVSRLSYLFGPGTVQLLHRRPGDATPYPVALTRRGDTVIWTINAADTAYSGEGQAELQYFVGDSLAKSETYATVITASLGDAGETPPEPQVGWVTQVLRAGTDAAEAAERAERAADRAESSAPVRGVDYWTAEDKQEIIEAVLAALGGNAPDVPEEPDEPDVPASNATARLGVARLGVMILGKE